MGRKPVDVPEEDRREMCRMKKEEGLGPRRIFRRFKEKYKVSHITRLLAKCDQVIRPRTARERVTKATSPNAVRVSVQNGMPKTFQEIKSQSTPPAVEQDVIKPYQVSPTQSDMNLTATTSPEPESIEDSEEDDYSNDSYPLNYEPQPVQMSLSSGLLDPAQVYIRAINQAFNSGMIRTAVQYSEKLSRQLFPHLYPPEPPQANDADRLSDEEKAVIQKAKDFIKRNEEERKSRALKETKSEVKPEESSASCPCSDVPSESSVGRTSQEIATAGLESELEDNQHPVDHAAQQSSNAKDTTVQESAPEIKTDTSVDANSKASEIDRGDTSKPPTADESNPPSTTELRPPVIDTTTSKFHTETHPKVYVDQKSSEVQDNASPNVDAQIIPSAHVAETANIHDKSGESETTIGLNSPSTPGNTRFNIFTPVAYENEKRMTPIATDNKMNNEVGPSTHPCEVEHHFIPVKSGESVTPAESNTPNDNESSGWKFFAVSLAGAAAVILIDLYRRSQPQFNGSKPTFMSVKNIGPTTAREKCARTHKPDDVAFF